jgi:hypothetical protein
MAGASIFFRIPKSVRDVLAKHDKPGPVWYSGTLHAENGHDVDLIPPPGATAEQLERMPAAPREIRRPEGKLDDALRRRR